MARSYLPLPPQTHPSDRALARRHRPRDVVTKYAVFRDCLRWDFGFTCAICLLHECDIVRYGIEGWAVSTAEHIVPRSHDKSLTGTYTNLLYICRLCNGARSDSDLCDDLGHRLLDPTADVWGHHFQLQGDLLLPTTPDAEYTLDVYAINDPRKVKLRRTRRESICRLLSLLSAASTRAQAVDTRPAAEAEIACIRQLLHPYSWIPEDAPTTCRCGKKKHYLPKCYLDQARRAATAMGAG